MKKKGLGSPAYELGIHIKKYREQKNWSQDDLASKIGTDQKRMLVSQQSMRRKSMRWKISWSGIKSNVPGIRTGKSWRST